jgi:hypothetical protein
MSEKNNADNSGLEASRMDKELRETKQELIDTLEELSRMVTREIGKDSSNNRLQQRKRHALNPRKPFPYYQGSRISNERPILKPNRPLYTPRYDDTSRGTSGSIDNESMTNLQRRKRHALNPRKPFPYNRGARLPSLTTANEIRHDPKLVQARGCTTCGSRLWDPI